MPSSRLRSGATGDPPDSPSVLVAFLALSAPAAAATPEVDARAYLVMDAASGEVLLARNAHDRHPIASITKLMTALLTDRACEAECDVVTVDPDAVRVTGSTIRLRAGERITVRDLMAAR